MPRNNCQEMAIISRHPIEWQHAGWQIPDATTAGTTNSVGSPLIINLIIGESVFKVLDRFPLLTNIGEGLDANVQVDLSPLLGNCRIAL